MKKKLKCTRYVIHTQLVHLASWRKWELRYSHPREQVNIIVLVQNGVGMSLEAAGLQLFLTTPFACHHNPLLGTVLNILSQEGVMRRQDMQNPALPLEMFPLRECSDLWVKFSSAAQSCLTLWDPMDCSTPVHTIILSITNSRSLLKLMSIEWWCHPTISSSSLLFPAFNLSQH